MSLFALAGGTSIFIGAIIILFFAIVFSYHTYRGSAINAHPSDGLDGAPGAGGPSDPAGRSQTPEDPRALENDGSISTHGTR